MTRWQSSSRARARLFTTANPECYNTAEVQENDLRFNFMKKIEVRKEETNKPIKEIKEMMNKIWRKLINPLKTDKQTVDGNK